MESERLGWTATNYSDLWGRTLNEGIKLKLGTLDPAKSVGILFKIYAFTMDLN